jgi:hypothetical protein
VSWKSRLALITTSMTLKTAVLAPISSAKGGWPRE